MARDDTVLTTVRPISNIQDLYNQFTEYRLEILEERIRQHLKDLRDANSCGRRVPTKKLKSFLEEQERFLAHMNREIIDDEKVVRGIQETIRHPKEKQSSGPEKRSRHD